MFDESCICGYPKMDHVYPLTPWWKFWANIYEYEFGACYNKDCTALLIPHLSKLEIRCKKFKLDNLRFVEDLAKEKGLV